MNNYHSNNGGYRQNRYSNSPRRRRKFGYNQNVISTDKLIAKAIDSEPVNMFVDDYNYSQFDITPILKKNIYNKGYSNPTKIQYDAIPQIIDGRDILGLASTGSGKTAAFLIPLINKISKDGDNKILILEPTRELASQVQDEFRQLATNTGLKSVLIIGGSSIRTQVDILRRDPEFVIATPGRLKDLSERGAIDLSIINNVVLDEVDRMLDMGFVDDIKLIIDKLDENRQSLFFSATMNRKSEEIANTLLHDPVKIEVEKQAPGKNVDQDVVRLEKGETKYDVLLKLLKQEELKKVLVFTSTKRSADKLCDKLYDDKIFVEALHGDKRQSQRMKIINDFKQGRVNILIATDVASRGLDVNNITHVINFDMPQTYEDYIHRIGRTGRAGKKGFALTFV